MAEAEMEEAVVVVTEEAGKVVVLVVGKEVMARVEAVTGGGCEEKEVVVEVTRVAVVMAGCRAAKAVGMEVVQDAEEGAVQMVVK